MTLENLRKLFNDMLVCQVGYYQAEHEKVTVAAESYRVARQKFLEASAEFVIVMLEDNQVTH